MNARCCLVVVATALLLVLALPVGSARMGMVPGHATDDDAASQAFLPLLHTPPCTSHRADLTLAAPAEIVQAGQLVTVTATLSNVGCGFLGLPQYRLFIHPVYGRSPSLELLDPGPITHYLAIYPWKSDTAQFVLRAAVPGEGTLTVAATFEFHAGYPGPAYWGGASSMPLTIKVGGEAGAEAPALQMADPTDATLGAAKRSACDPSATRDTTHSD